MELPYDLQQLIMESTSATLDGLKTLQNLSRLNRYTWKLIKSEEFWKRLYRIATSEVELPIVRNRVEIVGVSWKQLYINFVNSSGILDFDRFLTKPSQGSIFKQDLRGRDRLGRIFHFRAGDRIEHLSTNLMTGYTAIRYSPYLIRGIDRESYMADDPDEDPTIIKGLVYPQLWVIVKVN